MANDEIDELLSGTLGNFWLGAQATSSDEDHPGLVRQSGQWLELQVLEPNSHSAFMNDDPITHPEYIQAQTPHGLALLLDTEWTSQLIVLGPKASTTNFRASTLIFPVPLEELESAEVYSLQANFPGIGRWAGMQAASPTWQKHDDGRLRGFSTSVSSDVEYAAILPANRTLKIGTTWTVSGPEDRVTIYAPVSLVCESQTPSQTWHLLQPLIAIQDMLNIAFNGFVVADSGLATPHLKHAAGEVSRKTSGLWNGALMTVGPGCDTPNSMTERPLFTLAHLGGIEGVARWVRLYIDYPRAVRPAVSHYRHGKNLAETTLMDVASGIEYWVKCNSSCRWAQNTRHPGTKKRKGNFAAALSRWVGKPFDDWTGNSDNWSESFHEIYNKLKHDINYTPDWQTLSDLASSGRYLLAVGLLDHASQTRDPGKSIFASHRLHSLGKRLKSSFG